ncbi:hypothetical protein [Tumidithrix helvetica]|uniref:hypothetical protein n=1 Tax=Tumidithrix helvetica TaxID=3457545 RepID=UPI003CC5DF12
MSNQLKYHNLRVPVTFEFHGDQNHCSQYCQHRTTLKVLAITHNQTTNTDQEQFKGVHMRITDTTL